MTDKLVGRAAIETELRRWQQASAGLGSSVAARIDGLVFALAEFPEPAKRGRKPGNGAAKPVARIRKLKPALGQTLTDLINPA